MQFYRLDATYDDENDKTVGQMTTFVIAASLDHEKQWMEDAGWDVDAYEERESLAQSAKDLLLGHVWPTLPTHQLVQLADAPKADIRRQLEQAMTRKRKAAV